MSERSMTQNISDATSSALATQDQQATTVRPVDPEDSQHFQQLLKQPQVIEEAAIKGLGLPTLPTDDTALELAQLDGANVTFSVLPSAVPPQPTLQLASVDTPSTPSPRPVLQHIIEAVVESLAISTNKDNSQEMRIVLKDNILPSTEIRINATNHQLVVQFITASGSANQWLDQRLFTMQSALERVLNRPVDLSIFFDPHPQDGSANQERPYP
jgi:type III secretion system needle length determinant